VRGAHQAQLRNSQVQDNLVQLRYSLGLTVARVDSGDPQLLMPEMGWIYSCHSSVLTDAPDHSYFELLIECL
jgi:hypothetical protein